MARDKTLSSEFVPFDFPSLKKPEIKEEPQFGLEPMPHDELTGLAFPVVPYNRLVKEMVRDALRLRLPNRLGSIAMIIPGRDTSSHHAAFHSSRDELKVINGDVIRNARKQTLLGNGGGVTRGNKLEDWLTTHQRLHYFWFGQEWLPTTPDEQFEYAFWAAAFHVAKYGVDAEGQKPRVKKLYPDQIAKLHNGQIRVAGQVDLRNFAREHIINLSAEYLDIDLVEEFLNTPEENEPRRDELSDEIYSFASIIAAGPLENNYRVARKMGQVHPALHRTASGVIRKIVLEESWKSPTQALHEKLMKTYSEPAYIEEDVSESYEEESLQTGVVTVELPRAA